MKDDTISRAAAIKAADSIIERDTSGNNDVVKAMTAWKKFIEALPPAQPECEDTISRSHFDERVRLAGGISEEELTDDFKDGVLTVLEMLRTEPPVTPKQPGWIPCSERLPKKDGRYQVTRHDDVTNTEFIDILWYEGNLWWNRHSTGDYAVTAWMPLPAPYRPEGEEHGET